LAAARDSSRLATLAQAISSTPQVAPSMRKSSVLGSLSMYSSV